MLHLPRLLRLEELPRILGSLVGPGPEPRAGRVEIGFKHLEKVHTEGVAFLFNVIEWLRSQDVECVVRRPRKPRSWGNDYLDQMGFFEMATGKRLDQANQPNPTTLPLTYVANREGEQWVRMKLPRWLAGRLGVEPDELEALRIGVGEVLNNVRDHSEQPGGCVVAQHFQKDERVRLAISDIGVGIPFNVRKKLPGLTDAEALEKAIENGFSTQSIPGNRGAGFHTLLQQVVVEKGGEVSILSGDGRLDARRVTGRRVVTTRPLGGVYPGTLLLLVLPTDTLPEPSSEGDFQWS